MGKIRRKKTFLIFSKLHDFYFKKCKVSFDISCFQKHKKINYIYEYLPSSSSSSSSSIDI